MRPELKSQLESLLGERVRFDVALARYTSFRIGGPADALLNPCSSTELQAAVSLLWNAGVPIFVLGGGTNVLVSDRGIRGAVVRLGKRFQFARWRECADHARVTVGSATTLGRFVREAVGKGYGGVEFAEGIPGSVGGALLMNAGAYGGELGPAVERIEGILPMGDAVRLSKAQLVFAYRRATLPAGMIVTEVALQLQRREPQALCATVHAARARRRLSQPRAQPNAGSIFKNPSGKGAAKLIELSGLKGAEEGAARVSRRHANFIVNTGGARALEVQTLMEQIQQRVWSHHRVWLEPEIRLVGEW